MTIDWTKVHSDFRYKEIKGKKDHIRDMIKFKDFELFKRFMEEMKEEKKLHFRTKQYPCIAYSIID